MDDTVADALPILSRAHSQLFDLWLGASSRLFVTHLLPVSGTLDTRIGARLTSAHLVEVFRNRNLPWPPGAGTRVLVAKTSATRSRWASGGLVPQSTSPCSNS